MFGGVVVWWCGLVLCVGRLEGLLREEVGVADPAEDAPEDDGAGVAEQAFGSFHGEAHLVLKNKGFCVKVKRKPAGADPRALDG